MIDLKAEKDSAKTISRAQTAIYGDGAFRLAGGTRGSRAQETKWEEDGESKKSDSSPRRTSPAQTFSVVHSAC